MAPKAMSDKTAKSKATIQAGMLLKAEKEIAKMKEERAEAKKRLSRIRVEERAAQRKAKAFKKRHRKWNSTISWN